MRTKNNNTNNGVSIDNSSDLTLIKGESYLKDGRFKYRWTAEDGKRHVIYAHNLVDLRAAEEKIQFINRCKGVINPNNIIVNDLYDMWKELKTGIYDTTMRNYKSTYERHIYNSIGKKKLISLKYSDIKRFYATLLRDRRYSEDMVKRIHLVLHQVLQFGVNEGIITNNPSSDASKDLDTALKKILPPKFALTIEEEKAFLDACNCNPNGLIWWPLFVVMFETGMRISELSALTWEDIDFKKREIDINHVLVQTYIKGKSREIHVIPKTNAGYRKIPITDKAMNALVELKKYHTTEGIESVVEIDGYKNFVFLTRDREPVGQQSVNRAIARIVSKYNLEAEKSDVEPIRSFTTHIIRHTFGTRLTEKNASIKFIQYVMGHKDIQTTIDTYTHISRKILDDGTKLMNDSFELV